MDVAPIAGHLPRDLTSQVVTSQDSNQSVMSPPMAVVLMGRLSLLVLTSKGVLKKAHINSIVERHHMDAVLTREHQLKDLTMLDALQLKVTLVGLLTL